MIRILLIAIAMLSFAATANAQRTPRQFLGDLVEQAQTIQTNNGLYGDLVRHYFDTRRIGRFVLGRYWRHATAKQRWKFLEVFEAASIKRFSPMLKNMPLDTFRIVSVDDDDYNNIKVVSTITKNDKTIKIRWRLRVEYEPEYKIIDITAEGISMALTLRAEYGEVVRHHGLDGLISRLEDGLQTN